ncbi:hypothetical protein NCCNTM_49520 [Mycolicibacterium sp. NCC-Tsukiji]|nr:hypothetical protein NCCNTM_49520 [Mycolicibacterium sp. NCC-Tsukiji]
MVKPTKSRYSFEFKRDAVRRVIDQGATAQQVAHEYGLSSDKLVQSWVRAYRRDGDDGLRPKPKGRPPAVSGAPAAGAMSDLLRLE